MYFLNTHYGFYCGTTAETHLWYSDARYAFVFDTFESADEFAKKIMTDRTWVRSKLHQYYFIMKAG